MITVNICDKIKEKIIFGLFAIAAPVGIVHGERRSIMTIRSNYFYGNKISDYGLENGYVDYRTLAKAFDAVLNNDIMSVTCDIGYWDQVSGTIDNSEEIEELEEQIEELSNQLWEAETEETAKALEDKIAELEEKKAELEDEQDYPPEVFQWYIVDNNGADILQEADEIVYYNNELDMYLWGVTHWGTSWDYVLTNIKIEKEED